MSSWARVGVKVVCVDDSASHHGPCDLISGSIYVITEVIQGITAVGINVEGAVSKAQGFHLWRFRPLITESDDVALFAHHLTGVPVREEA